MTDKEQTPSIAPFTHTENLILHPFPNGGWVVTQEGPISGDRDARLGAYSSAEDMLKALSDALMSRRG